MTEQEPALEVEAGAVANESGLPLLQKCNFANSKKEGVVEDGEQEKIGVEGEEQKNIKEDALEEFENGKKLEDGNETGDANITVVTDTSMSEAEDAKAKVTENANVGDKTAERAMGANTEGMNVDKDTKTLDMVDQNIEDAEAAKAERPNNPNAEDAKGEVSKDLSAKEVEKEDLKDVNAEDAEEEKSKDVNLEDAEKVNSEGAKADDVECLDGKTVNAEGANEDSKDVEMVDAGGDIKDESGDSGEDEKTKSGKANGDKEGETKHEEDNDMKQEEKSEEANGNKDKGLNKKKPRGQKESEKGDGKEEKDGVNKAKLSSPLASPTIERPVRERKTVQRLVEVIDKEPAKEFQVEKGRGTALKDIPNVAYKIARKKPMDLKLIHQILFGRKGKAVNFKSHILQFSGFVWHESDEKQGAKMKEKLDNHVKDTLLDLCDLFDLSVSRSNSRKEDLVTKLLDFLIAPHATTDVLLSDKQPSAKTKKRKRASTRSASESKVDTPAKLSAKKQVESEDSPGAEDISDEETEDEGDGGETEDEDHHVSDEEKAPKHSESGENGSDSDEPDQEDNGADKSLGKGKPTKKKASKATSPTSNEKLKVSSSKKKPSSTAKSLKTPTSSKHVKIEDNGSGASRNEKLKVSTNSKKTPSSTAGSPKTPSSYKRVKIEDDGSGASRNEKLKVSTSSKKIPSSTSKSLKTPSSSEHAKVDGNVSGSSRKGKNVDSTKSKSTPKSDSKEKNSGKKLAKGKSKATEAETPSEDELRTKICQLLKEVDFNTATFTDILKRLAAHFKTDLTPRKASVKLMIQEELTKMAEEAEEDEDDGSDEENPKPAGKKIKA